jgi:mannobiose 2-epimerase
MDQRRLRKSIEQELQGDLLPFWRERSLDHARGGFIAEMTNDGALREDAPKGLILNARLLWTFSALYRELGDERDRELARRAYDYLEHYFRDPDYGGYLWRVDPDGQPLEVTKKVYGQAFCVYALSEYHRATGDANALRSAAETCNLIELHAHDARFGGYVEVLGADWSPVEDLRLSDKDMNVAKSMNNHLHILEAYTTLHSVWPNLVVAGRLRELIRLFDERMLTPSGHFDLFFDEQWKVRSDSYTYGHDIEGAWLLREAAAAVGDKEIEAQVSKRAVEVARAVYREGLDQEGGLAYEGRDGKVIDASREWWPQAEAMVGFWHVYRLTKEAAFAEAVARLWAFIERRIVDRVHGEWFWRVRADGSVDKREPKVSEWKDPYHATRMCLEMMRFLEE